MNESLQTANLGYAGAVGSVEQRNRVSAQHLLAARAVDGAHRARRLDRRDAPASSATMGAGMSFIVFLVGAFGFMFAIEKTKNSAAGVPVLLAFTFFMGLMLSRLIGHVLGFANGAGADHDGVRRHRRRSSSAWRRCPSVIKRDLSTMGKFLFVGAIMLLVAGIANIFLQSSALMITLSVLAIGIFSAFILYDLKRVQRRRGDELHHRHAGVYLSIYNVFQACWRSSASSAASRD